MKGSGVGSTESTLISVDFDGMDKEFLEGFCKKASFAFFKQHGLISHQVNSYNDFLKIGIQKVFDSVGEINVEPDPSMRGDDQEWKCISVKFGKVRIQRPTFWPGEEFTRERGLEFLELLPRHARLQKMSYSARMTAEINVQVYTKKLVRDDEFTAGAKHVVTELGTEYKCWEERLNSSTADKISLSNLQEYIRSTIIPAT